MQTIELVLLALPFILATWALAPKNHLAGLKQKISGIGLTCHSPFSHKEKCLITRARADVEPDIRCLLGSIGATEAFEVNLRGETIKRLTKPMFVEQYETRFILLTNLENRKI